jgi:hypothetical protein
MKRNLLRIAAVGASGLVGATGLVLGAGAASAAAPTTIGTLALSPATGTVGTPADLVTSGGCPTGDTFASAVVNSTNAGWTDITVLGTTDVGISNSGSFSEPMGNTLFTTAAQKGLTLAPGKYTFSLNCRPDGLSAPDAAFVGSIFVTGTPAQGVLQAYQSTDPNLPASTTTLAVTPASPAAAGASVTLTATVSPITNSGTVQFKDGTTALGAPVAVSAGKATYSSTAFSAGSHSFTAVYSGGTDEGASTSAATTYSVAGVVSPTTTSLSAPATVSQYSPAAFNVSTTAGTSGTVALVEGGSTIGTGTVTNGAGTVSTTFTTVGQHSVTAHFTPTGSFSPSDSAAVSVTVAASAGVTASEQIQTTIAAGSLTISVDDASTVVLPTPTLDPNAGVLSTGGAIHTVTVTDTRAGAPGFNVTGLASDFVNAKGDKIDAANLGWTPSIVDSTAGMIITAGSKVDPAQGIAPGAAADAALGIKSPRTLANNAAGHNGTAHLGAGLALLAPTSTQVGTYNSTLTLTAI